MKTKQQIFTYTFDPKACRLNFFTNGRRNGSSTGEPALNQYHRLVANNIEVKLVDEEKNFLIGRFHQVITRAGLLHRKSAIISAYGVEHTNELTADQLKELINRFNMADDQGKDDPGIRAWRSNVLAVLQKMGVYATNNDWSAVNEFVLKYSGKIIPKMNLEELKKAHRQYSSMLDSFRRKNEKLQTLAQLN